MQSIHKNNALTTAIVKTLRIVTKQNKFLQLHYNTFLEPEQESEDKKCQK